ncbi:hypothetical protein D3C87_1777860 [compost metagenome]
MEAGALFRQRNLTRAAVEQPDADALLESRYRTTDPRWREAENIRGPHEIARFHHRPENADPGQQPRVETHAPLRRKVGLRRPSCHDDLKSSYP